MVRCGSVCIKLKDWDERKKGGTERMSSGRNNDGRKVRKKTTQQKVIQNRRSEKSR